MATYTENYNLKMPSGQDAPDVEDFNGNTEIIDKALDAHANNFADKYDPGSTYTKGKLCIQNDALWKAKQNIDAPEPWTESHWESTTLAAELSAVNSSITVKNFSVSKNVAANEQASVTFNGEIIPDGYSVIAAFGSVSHVTTLCGCPIVEKNAAYLPYISKSALESEMFKLYVTLQRIS